MRFGFASRSNPVFAEAARAAGHDVERMCGANVDPNWARDQLLGAEFVAIVADDRQRDVAFAFGRPKFFGAERSLYVDLVCALPSHGAATMAFLEDEAERRGFDSVTLSALPQAFNFYRKLGYRPMRSCVAGVPVDVLRAWDAAGYQRFATGNEALAHAPTRALFERMVAHRMVPLACATVDECAGNGFVLRKCFERPRQQPRAVVRIQRPHETVRIQRPHETVRIRRPRASTPRTSNAPVARPAFEGQTAKGRDGRKWGVARRRAAGGGLYWRRAQPKT